MKYPVYAIRDKASAFMSPVVDQSDAAAIRNFANAVNSDTGIIGFQPSDFDLYKIGEYDDQNAQLSPVSPVEFIVNGAALVKRGDVPDAV